MNPYDIDPNSIKDSTEVTDKVTLLKIQLTANIVNNFRHLPQKELCQLTGLDKADVSRLLVADYQRFSIKRLINLNQKLGFNIEIKITKNKDFKLTTNKKN